MPPTEEQPDLFKGLEDDHDPFRSNPLPAEDAFHKIWNEATLDAWAEMHMLRSNLIKSSGEPGYAMEWRVNLAAAKFDIWAKRGVRVVCTDEALSAYANDWMHLFRERFSASIGLDSLLQALQSRLNERVERWKSLARAFVAESRVSQPSERGNHADQNATQTIDPKPTNAMDEFANKLDNRASIEAFIEEASKQAGVRVTKKIFYLALDYKTPWALQAFERNDQDPNKNTHKARRAFERQLREGVPAFLEVVRKKGLIKNKKSPA